MRLSLDFSWKRDRIRHRLPAPIGAEGRKSNISGFVVAGRLQKLILAYSALGIVATGTLVAGLSILPLYQYLKQDQEKTLLWLVETKARAVEEYLWQVNRRAWQIAERSSMPSEIEAYNKGKLSREALAKLSQPKLADALSQSEEIAGITRLDGAGKQAIAAGVPVPAEIWPLSAADSKTAVPKNVTIGPVFLAGAPYWVLGVPILNQKAKPVGTDIFLLKPDRLQQLLEERGSFGKTAATVLGSVRPDGEIAFFPVGNPKLAARSENIQKVPDRSQYNSHLQLAHLYELKRTALGIAIKKAVRQEKGLLTDNFHGRSLRQSSRPIGNGFANASGAVMAYSPIKGSNWGLVMKVDASELYAPVYSQIGAIGAAMFALSGLSAAGTVFVLRPIAKKSLNQAKELQQLVEEKTAYLQAQQNQRAAVAEALQEIERRAGEDWGNDSEWLWEWNLERESISCSPGCPARAGCAECEMGTHPDEWFKRIHPDDAERVKAEITIHLAGMTSYFQSEYRLIHPDGSYRWMRSRGVAIRDSQGRAICLEGATCDITARKAAEEENLRLAAFPINNPNPVLATDRWGNITYMNPATERLLAKTGMSDPIGFLPGNHAAIARRCLECGQGERQIDVTVADRVLSWSYHPIAESGTVHLYGTDITERQWAEEQLLQAALHDGLTGLPNRTLFIHRLEGAISRAKKQQAHLFAVLFLDLDRFKVVNDSLGHVLGDRFLIAIARRLETCLRPGDVVARLGGDEFTILLCGFADISAVNRFADRIQEELSLPVNLNGHEVFTTASIGITVAAYSQKPGAADAFARPYEQPEDLLRDADLAMYRAKAEGKARYVVFDSTMHKCAVALLQMENDLRRALNEGGKPVLEGGIHSEETSHPAPFLLHYQPIVALDTGRIAGFEALARWIHPERGLISPAEFIPVAEESGLIVPLGTWVLAEACRQLRQWQEKFPAARDLTMSVNLSGKQLAQPDLLPQIDAILQQTGIDPNCLKLEITESVLMDNAAAAVALLEQLRARNIGLCIDDFGTGYSSLSYLHRFPINTLKIDRSFVLEMAGDNENSEIARAIVMLAHNLGMYVVAEGVETEKHLVQLWAMQCEYGQGYFFSKPLDREAAEALIAAEPQW